MDAYAKKYKRKMVCIMSLLPPVFKDETVWQYRGKYKRRSQFDTGFAPVRGCRLFADFVLRNDEHFRQLIDEPMEFLFSAKALQEFLHYHGRPLLFTSIPQAREHLSLRARNVDSWLSGTLDAYCDYVFLRSSCACHNEFRTWHHEKADYRYRRESSGFEDDYNYNNEVWHNAIKWAYEAWKWEFRKLFPEMPALWVDRGENPPIPTPDAWKRFKETISKMWSLGAWCKKDDLCILWR